VRVAAIALSCAVLACSSSPWRAPLHREHPLVGKIWNGTALVDEQTLDAAVRSAHFVLLGETHDNPDHHALEARLVRAAAQNRKPAIVFEMLDVGEQPAIDAAPRTSDAIANAVNWSQSGWPDFSSYRPVFDAALSAGLPVVAGNFTKAQMHTIVMGGPAKLPPDLAALLQRPGAPPVDEAERAEMQAEHCGLLPDKLLDPMVLAQHARDAQLATRMAGQDAGSILIAGSGHVRTDRGAPVYLGMLAPGRLVVSVAFVEVSPTFQTPQEYAASFDVSRLPFEFVVFTPAAQREDPCKQLEQRMKSGPGHHQRVTNRVPVAVGTGSQFR
jgi:uncharacterized iron-regulated protein